MLPFKLVYTDQYLLPIGEHVFPAQKYWLVKTRLLENGIAELEDLVAPPPASNEDVLLVHTEAYVRKLRTATLSPQEQLQMEIPYSRPLVNAFWLAAGGSILAADLALKDGLAINLGGGFHHAFPDHGEGFCMINDIAIAIRRMQHDGRIHRAMTVDCDVHQGNGTAVIFGAPRPAVKRVPAFSWSATMFEPEDLEPEPESPPPEAPPGCKVFTISLHQENNYPAWKPPSSLDVNLPDGIGDADYLTRLKDAFISGLSQFDPELISYVAGADPYREDQLGGLGLTIEGLKQRDELVFRMAKERGIPVMVTLAGGYALNVDDTVTIHANTVQAAKEVWEK